MSVPIEQTTQSLNPESTIQPGVVYGEGVDPSISVDPSHVAQTMIDLGVSNQAIANTIIYMDPKSHLLTHGTHYPNRFGRIRFHSVPEVREAKGDIIRLSTVMRGIPRSADEINSVLIHELEHTAQQDRHDKNLNIGRIAIWGLAATGAILGSRLGGNDASWSIGAVMGAAIGHSIGYKIAPHERQARKRALQITTGAVERK